MVSARVSRAISAAALPRVSFTGRPLFHAQRTDIRCQLPEWLAGQLRTEGGHPVGSALENGGVNACIGAAIDPAVIRERRPDSPTTGVTMTPVAVERLVEILALGECGLVAAPWICD